MLAGILTPKTYLSHSEGRWRVIHQSQPISNDKKTAAEALRAAEQFKLKVDTSVIWEGDSGEWVKK